MSAASDLIFLRTGEEASDFVLVEMFPQDGATRARASLRRAGPDARSDHKDYTGRQDGHLTDIFTEAKEFAALNGFDLRVELQGVEWPDALGTLITPPSAK